MSPVRTCAYTGIFARMGLAFQSLLSTLFSLLVISYVFLVGDSQYFPARKEKASECCKYFGFICFFWPIHSSASIETEDPLNHHVRILFVFPDVGFDPLARFIQVALWRSQQLFSLPMVQRCEESDFFALHLRTLYQSLLACISIAIMAFQVFLYL